jgi:cytochrome c oxidase subunit III
MWVFLVSEVLFFSVLFFGYLVTRLHHPLGFALGSRHTDVIIGSLNTAVLLTSSLSMALAGRSAAGGSTRSATALLAVTAALGTAFLALKALEYGHDIQHHLVPWRDFSLASAADDGGARLFFLLYFIMTGAHALHLLVGISLVLVVMAAVARGRRRTRHAETVEITGLYWHLVDIVWIFLYPLLYLVSRT